MLCGASALPGSSLKGGQGTQGPLLATVGRLGSQRGPAGGFPLIFLLGSGPSFNTQKTVRLNCSDVVGNGGSNAVLYIFIDMSSTTAAFIRE